MKKVPNLHSYEHGGVPAPPPIFVSPAVGLLPLMRWPLGYETLSPFKAAKRFLILFLVPPVGWTVLELLHHFPPENENRQYFYIYALASFVMTLLRFMQRAIGQHTGEEIHTAEAGYSLVAHVLPLSPAVTEQFIVPSLLGWGGWQVAQVYSADLGYWLMVCAASYFILANYEIRNRWAQRRAPVDDKIRAQAFADNVDRHEQQVAKSKKARGKAAPIYAAHDVPDIAEFGGGRRRR
jgi:hypothetical protein